MGEQLRFFLNRLRQRLWIKPLLFCLLSIAAALLAQLADTVPISANLERLIPDVNQDSIEDLLKISAASMLVIATFSVSSMVAAYASAGNTATPRAFSLVIADDVSQNALSTFIGVFIYSIVALVALMNGVYEKSGRFLLISLTLISLTVVIVTFVRWVDKIARLGRLGNVIDKVEAATANAMRDRQAFPNLRGVPATLSAEHATAVYAETVGYVQWIDTGKLQSCACEYNLRILVAALPGTFATPDRPIAYVLPDDLSADITDTAHIGQSFVIGQDRLFDHDPRFGLVVLSEIASRALSPAVNDPGTAIDIIGTLVRLFVHWSASRELEQTPECDRVFVPDLSVADMFDDAFTAIARDGAGFLEVQVRLQKALQTLAARDNDAMRLAARRHTRSALARAEQTITFEPDLQLIRGAAKITD
ncbi:MAG: putative membrane protein [Candidatus Paceibacteria bacterium]|jgi:uncharacterized membrane protein